MRSRSAGWCARRYQRAAHNPPDGLNGGLLGPLRGVVRSFYQPATIPLAGGVPTTPSDIVGIRSPKAAPSSRRCGRRVVPNRWWRRQWRSRRRVAAPRSLAFSGQTAPSNEGLEQTSLGPSLRSGPDREAAQSHVGRSDCRGGGAAWCEPFGMWAHVESPHVKVRAQRVASLVPLRGTSLRLWGPV